MKKNQHPSFASFGEKVTVYPLAKIVGADTMHVGSNVIIDDFVFIVSAHTMIGDYVHIGAFSSIVGGGHFVMEDFSGLSNGVRIFTGNDDYSGDYLTNPTVEKAFRNVKRDGVHIGKHAIIGANAVILPGVHIGEGAIVGANSLVKKDVPPWTMVGGSPARFLKKRNNTLLRMEAILRKDPR